MKDTIQVMPECLHWVNTLKHSAVELLVVFWIFFVLLLQIAGVSIMTHTRACVMFCQKALINFLLNSGSAYNNACNRFYGNYGGRCT